MLCGIIPAIESSSATENILKERRQEFQAKEEKISLIEDFSKWSLKKTNSETLLRMIITEKIF